MGKAFESVPPSLLKTFQKNIKKLLTNTYLCGIIRMWKGKATQTTKKNNFVKESD